LSKDKRPESPIREPHGLPSSRFVVDLSLLLKQASSVLDALCLHVSLTFILAIVKCGNVSP